VKTGSPGQNHEERRAILDTIAVVSGYFGRRYDVLPDGIRPDVVRVDPRCGGVFIGEAKDTESPGQEAARSRLARYFQWLVALDQTRQGPSTIAVCFGRPVDQRRWVTTLTRLGHEAGLKGFTAECHRVDETAFVAWLRRRQPAEVSRGSRATREDATREERKRRDTVPTARKGQ
jgi:hypothetical protein